MLCWTLYLGWQWTIIHSLLSPPRCCLETDHYNHWPDVSLVASCAWSVGGVSKKPNDRNEMWASTPPAVSLKGTSWMHPWSPQHLAGGSPANSSQTAPVRASFALHLSAWRQGLRSPTAVSSKGLHHSSGLSLINALRLKSPHFYILSSSFRDPNKQEQLCKNAYVYYHMIHSYTCNYMITQLLYL